MKEGGAVLKQLFEKAGVSCSEGESMAIHTTFRIGGPADYFLTPLSENELFAALDICRSAGISPFLLGNGSNLLVSDAGIRGVVISLVSLDHIVDNGGGVLSVQTGAGLSKLALYARDNSLSGLEFAYGIPGTVGGAIYMNAGAYGGEMRDVVLSTRAILPDGICHCFEGDENQFSYRKSIFSENGAVILSARLHLKTGDRRNIGEKMEELMKRRRDKQPLEYPSAGSVFKRPEGRYAGPLIESAGLKGFSIGGAQVSIKHAGFIVNTGNATCEDVKKLIHHIEERVFATSGVRLESEIKLIG